MRLRRFFFCIPFLLALYFFLFIYSQNINQISFSETLVPLGVTFAVIGFLLFLCGGFFKSETKAVSFVTLVVFLFFSYGHLYSLIRDCEVAGFEIGRHRYQSGLYLSILFLVFVFLWRTKREAAGVLRYLLGIVLVLLCLSLVTILSYEIRWRDYRGFHDHLTLKRPGHVADPMPSIYYIILDGYPREDVLRKFYQFDNTPFLNSLQKMGFVIAKESRSNYAMTFLSLASSLNLLYLDDFMPPIDKRTTGKVIPDIFYQKSVAHRFLKEQGYELIQFASGWGPTNKNNYADTLHKRFCVFSSEFMSAFVGTTWLNPLSLRMVEQDARRQILAVFEKLPQIAANEKPVFVFAHVLVPHTPLFGKTGKPLLKSFGMRDAESSFTGSQQFIDQLQYINEKVLGLLRDIISNSKTQPVIVLQADHGTASSGWKPVTPELIEERTAILNAYYASEDVQSQLYDTITPVNSFRLIFSRLFSADYPFLPDRSYFSTYDKPYDFLETIELVGPQSADAKS